jgi:hypothetical protein
MRAHQPLVPYAVRLVRVRVLPALQILDVRLVVALGVSHVACCWGPAGARTRAPSRDSRQAVWSDFVTTDVPRQGRFGTSQSGDGTEPLASRNQTPPGDVTR